MRRFDFLVIGVSVRWPMEVQADEHDDLPTPILHLDLAKIDPTSAEIKQELFPAVGRLKRERDRFTVRRERAVLVIAAMLFRREESVGLGLGQVQISHQDIQPESVAR